MKFNQRFLLEDTAHDDILELKCGGYHLNQIIQHCNNLLHLSMQQAQLLQLNSTTEQFVNESIVYIELSNCEICNAVFHEISSRLPSLKQLSLLHCTFYNNVKDWKSGETASSVSIDMPYTSFTKFSIELSQYAIKGVYIKLTTTENG